MKKIYFTVTNDLNLDQRMHRICTSLAENNYAVTLVGRELPGSLPLSPKKYSQHRLHCWFKKGKLFYVEFNFRLSLFLLLKKMDAVCAIDLDTIHPCWLVSWLKNIPRIYDAHELFTEMKEVISRPAIKRLWDKAEKKMVPKFKLGYTVSNGIADEFHKRYGVQYEVIRNVPVLLNEEPVSTTEKFILYQGAVNEGRAFESLIPAMKTVKCKLVICGDGNFMPQLKKLVAENGVSDKIEIKGWTKPEELRRITQQALMGIAISEKEGLNQWLALPNKFFDYLHAGIPQIAMNFPEYREINKQYEVAVLLDNTFPGTVSAAINSLIQDEEKRNRITRNCHAAKQELNWQREEKKLLAFYKKVFE